MTGASFAETDRSSGRRLEVSGIVAGATPREVLDAFTSAEGLVAWWSEEAEVDPRPGGSIVASWPSRSWTMRGTFTDVGERSLSFTWSWDHEPGAAARVVGVAVAAEVAGTRLTITHGEYGPDEEAERAEHRDGWLFFLPRLAASVGGG